MSLIGKYRLRASWQQLKYFYCLQHKQKSVPCVLAHSPLRTEIGPNIYTTAAFAITLSMAVMVLKYQAFGTFVCSIQFKGCHTSMCLQLKNLIQFLSI